ncbi:Flp family type IVb pilin [Gymnodinialimonas ulvae]|uniref:Flp family type IVb pilin n=1 Tax=Gymnodinialimonas ulvae TaxID=3126504 RepID=UPI00309B1A1A
MTFSALFFLRSESGAVGVDWVMMGAGVVAGVMAMLTVVSDGTNGLVGNVTGQLAQFEIGTVPNGLPGGVRPGEGGSGFGGSGSAGGVGNSDWRDLGGGFGTGTGGGAGSDGSGEIDPEGEEIEVAELPVVESDPEVLIVDAALVVEEVIEALVEEALDDAVVAQEVLAQREIWAARVGNAAFPQASEVVAALDVVLVNRGVTPPA